MPIPVNKLDPDVAAYLQQLEDRLAARELALQPYPVFACTTANMPPASAFVGCVLRNTTLNILAHSDGVNWRREDTGAIV